MSAFQGWRLPPLYSCRKPRKWFRATSSEQRTKQPSQSQKELLSQNDNSVGLQNDITVSQLHTDEERTEQGTIHSGLHTAVRPGERRRRDNLSLPLHCTAVRAKRSKVRVINGLSCEPAVWSLVLHLMMSCTVWSMAFLYFVQYRPCIIPSH